VTTRVPSDRDAVESHRVHLATVGRTGRLQVPLPEGLSLGADDLVSLSLAGTRTHATVERTLDDDLAVRGAYADRNLARSRDGSDELAAWLDDAALTSGDPLLFDVIAPGYAYGLRLPGDRVLYERPKEPDRSLRSIAEDLE